MNKIQGVLIGCGFFASNHMNAWNEIPNVEITAICDRDTKKLDQFAEKINFTGCLFTTFDDLVKETKSDFIDVVTNPESHFEIVSKASKSIPHIICQKPFANNAEDIQKMIQICQKNRSSLTIHENFRFQTPFREAKKLIEKNLLGDLFYIHLSFRSGYDVYSDQPYLAETERFTLMDVGVHLLDVARYFGGEAETLDCCTQSINPLVRGEDIFYVTLRHLDGAVSQISCSYATCIDPTEEPFPATITVIEGTKGTLTIDRHGCMRLHECEKKVKEIDIPPPNLSWQDEQFKLIQNSVVNFQTDYIRHLKNNTLPETYAQDNQKTMELVFAAYESSTKKQTIKFKN